MQLRRITFLCRDPEALARFWAAVFLKTVAHDSDGFHLNWDEGNEPDSVCFKAASETERPGAAVRLGVGALSGSLDEEIARLIRLGAVLISRSEDPLDRARVTMADPEGNEFTVEESEEELLNEELDGLLEH